MNNAKIFLNDYPLDSTLHRASVALAGKNSLLFSHPTAWDVSPGETSAPQRQKSIFMTLILSGIWSRALIGRRICYKTVCIRGIYYSLEEAFEFCWSLFKEHKNLPKSIRRNKIEQIYICNPGLPDELCKHNLRHQYGISVAEVHTSLLAKRSKWRGVRKDGCFCRLQLLER